MAKEFPVTIEFRPWTARTGPARTEPTRSGPARTEPTRNRQARTEPARSGPTRTGPFMRISRAGM